MSPFQHFLVYQDTRVNAIRLSGKFRCISKAPATGFSLIELLVVIAIIGLLALLVLYHVQCGRWLLDFKHDRNRRGHVYYRWMNEVPVLFLVGIVLLAVLKPF